MLKLTKIKSQLSAIPKILLVDEDLVFCHKIVSAALRLNIQVECKTKVDDVYESPPHHPEVLILGYDLGRVTGVQLSQYLERCAKAQFIILVIHGNLKKLQTRLPKSVRAIISKDTGTEHILEIARSLFHCYRPRG